MATIHNEQEIAAQGTGRGWLLLLGVICLLCTAASLWAGHTRDYIGSPDQAAYADQADSLLAGRGLTIGYVQHFYRRYAHPLHPEDHYAPGMGFMLAGAFFLFGRSEFTAIIPSILFACLLLPFLSYLLARRLLLRPPLAVATAVSVLFALPIREHAFYALADLPFAVCILGATVCLAGQKRALPIGMAGFLAAAFYFKPTALLFLPIFLPGFIIRWWPDWKPAARSFIFSAFLFVVLISPLLIRNIRLFGDPLYSANSYVAAGIDYDPAFWDRQFAKIWWADPTATLPTLSTVLRQFTPRHVFSVVFSRIYRALFVVSGWASIAIFFTCFTSHFLLARWRRKRSCGRQERKLLIISLIPPLFVLALSLTFSMRARYLLPIIPLGMILAWVLLVSGIERLHRSTFFRWRSPFASAALIIGLLLLCSVAGIVELGQHCTGQVALQRDDTTVKVPALWAARHLPVDACIMSQEAWQFRYYAQHPVVNIPCDSPERIETVITAYDVKYLFLWEGWETRQAFARLLPYLRVYGDRWKQIPVASASFIVYARKTERPQTKQQWPRKTRAIDASVILDGYMP